MGREIDIQPVRTIDSLGGAITSRGLSKRSAATFN